MTKILIEVSYENFSIITFDNGVKDCLPEWSNDEREKFNSDIEDCTAGGDIEPAVQYMLDNYEIEWIVNDERELSQIMRDNCEYIYFDGLEDEPEKFADLDTCKVYAMWQAASDYVYNRDERKEAIITIINEHVSDQLEYTEYHEDSGDNYSHMPREGGFDYSEGETRLRKYCDDNELTFNDDLVDYVLDNFTMESVHIHKNVNNSSDFYVDGYAIGEIEIDLQYVMDNKNIAYYELMQVDNDCECYITGTSRAYVTSDRAWNCVISLDSIKSFLNGDS